MSVFKLRKYSNGVAKISRDSYGADWKSTKARVHERDAHSCRDCGLPSKELHAHHIIPVSRGGMTVMSNLISLCEVCHTKRHKHMR